MGLSFFTSFADFSFGRFDFPPSNPLCRAFSSCCLMLYAFSISTMARWFFVNATVMGVDPYLSVTSTIAPCFSNNSTISMQPFAAAKWSGVDPVVPMGWPEARLFSPLERRGWRGAFTFAPCSMRYCNTLTLPLTQAACIGRTPLRTESIGWPWSSANFTRPDKRGEGNVKSWVVEKDAKLGWIRGWDLIV